MSKSDDLMKALTELAKAEVAFTNETQADGQTIYVIDTVRLTEDEVIRLHKKGALTPDGIRRYLVDRVA
jgi:hypothetical protein